jgi:hypothetical protein
MVESEEYCHRNDPQKCVARCDAHASAISRFYLAKKNDATFL